MSREVCEHNKLIGAECKDCTIDRLTEENNQLKADQLKFYKADGSFIVCESVEQVVEMRKAAAVEIESVKAERDALETEADRQNVRAEKAEAELRKSNKLHLAAIDRFEKAEAERDRLKKALMLISFGSEDKEPPFRNMPYDNIRRIASAALNNKT